jgi:CO/xanthine dehydrogenase FAD-binding subunit
MGPCLKFGGDVCHVVKKGKKCLAIFQADMVPALIALAATLKVESSDGEKTIPIEDFYRDDGKDYLKLKAGEIISEIQIPNLGSGTGGSYQKLRTRKSVDFALVAASVNLKLRNGLCEDVRIVLGSVGTCPIRVGKAEGVLRGKKMTDDVIEEAAEFAYKDAKPVANIVNVPPSYRKEMARIMMMQAAKEALSRVR